MKGFHEGSKCRLQQDYEEETVTCCNKYNIQVKLLLTTLHTKHIFFDVLIKQSSFAIIWPFSL
jgi:hypothetical protein